MTGTTVNGNTRIAWKLISIYEVYTQTIPQISSHNLYYTKTVRYRSGTNRPYTKTVRDSDSNIRIAIVWV